MLDDETAMAFVVSEHEQPAIEIRVNFGILAGREATPAEIDHLAGRLLDEVETVTIVAEERHEIVDLRLVDTRARRRCSRRREREDRGKRRREQNLLQENPL